MRNDKLPRYGAGAGMELAGTLAKYTSVGCYPLYYLDTCGSTLCRDCAQEQEAGEGDELTDADVNWEDPELVCDGCGRRIESAYAD